MKFDPTMLVRPNVHGPLVKAITGFRCHNHHNQSKLPNSLLLETLLLFPGKSIFHLEVVLTTKLQTS